MYEKLLRPLLFRIDPERIHELVMGLLARTPAASLLGPAASRTQRPCRLWGLEFRNRLGLAAGFDKNAVAIGAWRRLGFGFVEVGTVTRLAQPGNPRPRIFRCPEARALINRMGFPNDGAEAVARRIEAARARERLDRFPVGVNIGKSKVVPLDAAEEDYLETYRTLYPHGDFFVVNVSSPNTPGLRELQHPEQLRPILSALGRFRGDQPLRKPLLVKIAPDLDDDQIGAIVALARESGLEGIVATNTTVHHRGVDLDETGGLSGPPLAARSTEVIRRLRELAGDSLTIIGTGGVSDPDGYLEKRRAGADLIELYTAFVYAGPRVVDSILGAIDQEAP